MRLKYFEQEPIQRRFDFSGVLYFGWPNQPSSSTMRVNIGLFFCIYIYVSNRPQVSMVYRYDKPLGMLEEHSKNS